MTAVGDISLNMENLHTPVARRLTLLQLQAPNGSPNPQGSTLNTFTYEQDSMDSVGLMHIHVKIITCSMNFNCS